MPVQEPILGASRGTGCSRCGVIWALKQDSGRGKIRSELSHACLAADRDGSASVAEGICPACSRQAFPCS